MNPSSPSNDPSPEQEGNGAGRLSEARLNAIWDRLQGAEERRGRETSRYGRTEWLRDCGITLWVTGWVHRLAYGVTAVAVLVFLFFGLPAPELELRTPSTWLATNAIALPEVLRFRPKEQMQASLQGTYGLAGNSNRERGRGGSDGFTVWNLTISGVNNGQSISFDGTLTMTNAPGVVNGRKAADFLGGLLHGALTIGTNAPVIVNQPYEFRVPGN